MGLGELYKKRYRRQQRRQMMAIMALLIVVAAMLVGVRACADKVNQDLQETFNPLGGNQKMDQKLKEKIQKKLREMGR